MDNVEVECQVCGTKFITAFGSSNTRFNIPNWSCCRCDGPGKVKLELVELKKTLKESK